MSQFKEFKPTCSKCNTEISKKEVKPENCDVNTQSLLLMFQMRDIIMVECPKCSTKRMLINNIQSGLIF